MKLYTVITLTVWTRQPVFAFVLSGTLLVHSLIRLYQPYLSVLLLQPWKITVQIFWTNKVYQGDFEGFNWASQYFRNES